MTFAEALLQLRRLLPDAVFHIGFGVWVPAPSSDASMSMFWRLFLPEGEFDAEARTLDDLVQHVKTLTASPKYREFRLKQAQARGEAKIAADAIVQSVSDALAAGMEEQFDANA